MGLIYHKMMMMIYKSLGRLEPEKKEFFYFVFNFNEKKTTRMNPCVCVLMDVDDGFVIVLVVNFVISKWKNFLKILCLCMVLFLVSGFLLLLLFWLFITRKLFVWFVVDVFFCCCCYCQL